MYITSQYCISAQHSSSGFNFSQAPESPAENHFLAIEPPYSFIPVSSLRRMGKLVRMGLGAALPLLQNTTPSAIIMATANAGKDDCVNFLNQIIEYDEGMLTPLNFVQSTPNSLAGQIGLISQNRGYNITHVHLGHAFENALLDAQMWLTDHPESQVLLGAADDLNRYHELYEQKAGWVKAKSEGENNFLDSNTPGSFHGEAATMFMTSLSAKNAILKIAAVEIWDGEDEKDLTDRVERFLTAHHKGASQPVLYSGENGDCRILKYYNLMEKSILDGAKFRYKQACGEFPTSTSFALWLAGESYLQKKWPLTLLKNGTVPDQMENILIYNCYKGIQHSLILVEPV